MSSADLFAIGASGLKSFRAQMGAVSENIANSDTPNYNRRTVNIKESALSVSTEPLYIPRADFGGSEHATSGVPRTFAIAGVFTGKAAHVNVGRSQTPR